MSQALLPALNACVGFYLTERSLNIWSPSSFLNIWSPSSKGSSQLMGLFLGFMAIIIASFHLITEETSEGRSKALSVVAGYLAFRLVCLPSTNLLRSLEDSLTLAAIVKVLWESTPLELEHSTFFAMWLLYKMVAMTTTLLYLPSDESTKTNEKANLWVIHGISYDLSDYVKNHPGGQDAIELGKGREDCTALFESYHAFSSARVRKILQKYQVGDGPVADVVSKDPFYDILIERVAATLKQHGVDPVTDRVAPWKRLAYYAVVLVGMLLSLVPHIRGNALGSIALGLFGSQAAATIGHDGGHYAISHRHWINTVGLWCMGLLSNPVLWQHQHTFAHHCFTNDFDRDPDLHHFGENLSAFLGISMRLHRRFEHKSYHKFQGSRFGVISILSLVVFGLCISIPLSVAHTGSLHGVVEWTDRSRPLWRLAYWAHMVLYISVIVLAPFFCGASWLEALRSVLLQVATVGLYFGIVSQTNHITENCMEVNTKKRKPLAMNSWAADQVETTNDFIADSLLVDVIAANLNYQIEHHLFPGLNHGHLRLIAPVVQQTCEEYGVRYKVYGSWSEILLAYFSWLEKLSQEQDVVPGGSSKKL